MSNDAKSSRKMKIWKWLLNLAQGRFLVLQKSNFRGMMSTEAKLEQTENTIIQDMKY